MTDVRTEPANRPTDRPTNTAQVAESLAQAHRAGKIVAVRGHGTKHAFGGVGAEADVVLDLSGMPQLLEHQPGDLIVRAQAGMALHDLQTQLAPAGQRLSIDEPVAGSTLGGVVATNTSGPRRLHTGTARDLLIGVTLVLADGTIARSGGKVVKNVAGYDLGKLLVGSFGTLAVITEVTFRLHPVPAAGAWVHTRIEAGALESVLAPLCHTQLAPAALELDWRPGESPTVAVLLEGTAEGVPGRVEQARATLGADTHVDAELDWPWHYPGAHDGSQTIFKITSRLGAVAETAAAATDLGLHVRGSAGTGVLYAAAPAETSAAAVAGMLRTLRPLVSRAGGAVVVLAGPREVRSNVDVWGPVNGLPVMRRLKAQFDPERLLAPGSFVGGI